MQHCQQYSETSVCQEKKTSEALAEAQGKTLSRWRRRPPNEIETNYVGNSEPKKHGTNGTVAAANIQVDDVERLAVIRCRDIRRDKRGYRTTS